MGAHSEDSQSATNADEELCRAFDKELLSPGCHSLSLRVLHCAPAKVLRARGIEALPAILKHLEAHKGLDKLDLRQAWGLQLYTMQLRIDPDDKTEVALWDTAAWIVWAKNVLEGGKG